MAGWADLAKMLLLQTALVHPQGHMQTAANLGNPGKIDYKTFTESYDRNLDTMPPKQEMAIQGAGFKNQDDFARGLSGDDKAAAYLANALTKASYASGLTDKITQHLNPGVGFADHYGDLGGMNRLSGTKLARPLYGFAALADLYKSQHPEQNWDISAGPIDGSRALGLKFTTRW
jgi:hypothetical protein